jgi:hypothetical protein
VNFPQTAQFLPRVGMGKMRSFSQAQMIFHGERESDNSYFAQNIKIDEDAKT